MKKIVMLIGLLLSAIAFTPPAEAQNNSYLVSRTYTAATGWYLKMDTVINKGVIMIQLFDSVQNKWMHPNSAVVVDSLVADTISNTKDAAFFQTLINHQKTSGNTNGYFDKTWFYRWVAAGRLYYKARYTKMLIFYRN